MKNHQGDISTLPALLRTAVSVDTLETNSLCCAAAGIIATATATADALIPHEKLREAATSGATLTAQTRPTAQPVEGYKPLLPNQETPPQQAVELFQIDERVEFEKEFPTHEGLRYCRQSGTYITTPGASTSDTFAREHYAYRAGFTAWIRRACKGEAKA